MVYRRVGLGHTIGVDPNGQTSFTVIGALSNLTGGDSSKDDIDVSLYADTTKQFLPGQIDSGKFEFEVALDRQDAEGIVLAQLFGRGASGIVPTWQITSPTVPGSTAIQTRNFAGYVNALSEAYPKDGLITRKVGIKVCGDPGYTST